jgi:hypothetical protein
MSEATIIGIFVIVVLICVPLNVYIRSANGILAENGTCTNGNVTIGASQVNDTNRSTGDFFKNLTADNRHLAELICQNMLNETTPR